MFKLNKGIEDNDDLEIVEETMENEISEVKLFEEELKEEQGQVEELVVPINSKIIGDIETDIDDILISGTLIGNIISNATVRVEGEVRGNIKAKNLILNKGSIEGNLDISEEISTKIETVVVGDILAKEATIDGQVTGNINSNLSIHLQKNSLIEGNLETKQLSILKGAIFNGQIKTVQEN